MLQIVVRYSLLLLIVTHFTFLSAERNSKDFLKREHSLVRPYQGSGFGVPNWDFQGSTMVTSNYIRLTPDDRSRQGAIWNKVPCRVRNWEVQINFKVTGTTKVSSFKILASNSLMSSQDQAKHRVFLIGSISVSTLL